MAAKQKRERMNLGINGDTVCFKTDNEMYCSTIEHDCCGSWYLKGVIFNNHQLFSNAGIEDVEKFQLKILGYSFNAYCFPSCRTREDVIKLARAVVDYNNEQIKCNNVFSLKKRLPIKFNFNL